MFQLRIMFGDPCQALYQSRLTVNAPNDIQAAIQHCHVIFRDQITLKLKALVEQRHGPKTIQPSQKDNQRNKLDNAIQSPVLLKRGKADFCCGASASNILETVIDKIWLDPRLADGDVLIEKKVNDLNQVANFTQLQIQAVTESYALLVAHKVERLDTIAIIYPQL